MVWYFDVLYNRHLGGRRRSRRAERKQRTLRSCASVSPSVRCHARLTAAPHAAPPCVLSTRLDANSGFPGTTFTATRPRSPRARFPPRLSPRALPTDWAISRRSSSRSVLSRLLRLESELEVEIFHLHEFIKCYIGSSLSSTCVVAASTSKHTAAFITRSRLL